MVGHNETTVTLMIPRGSVNSPSPLLIRVNEAAPTSDSVGATVTVQVAASCVMKLYTPGLNMTTGVAVQTIDQDCEGLAVSWINSFDTVIVLDSPALTEATCVGS